MITTIIVERIMIMIITRTYLPVTAPPTAIAAPPIIPRPRPKFHMKKRKRENS